MSRELGVNAGCAGALICAATDSHNGINLHGELMSYVEAGMTPFEALTTATVNPRARSVRTRARLSRASSPTSY